jgi:hypothetical protein
MTRPIAEAYPSGVVVNFSVDRLENLEASARIRAQGGGRYTEYPVRWLHFFVAILLDGWSH